MNSAFEGCARNRLWSLWDIMLKKAATDFADAFSALVVAERLSFTFLTLMKETSIADEAHPLHKHSIEMLTRVKQACLMADLDGIIPEIGRFEKTLEGPTSISDIGSRAKHLRERLKDELENEFYFQVDRQNVKLYQRKELFGPEVDVKLGASAAEDIESAGSCLALGQSTAAMFHLMRVMEISVQKFGDKVGVALASEKNWQNILDEINKAIKKLDQRADQTRVRTY